MSDKNYLDGVRRGQAYNLSQDINPMIKLDEFKYINLNNIVSVMKNELGNIQLNLTDGSFETVSTIVFRDKIKPKLEYDSFKYTSHRFLEHYTKSDEFQNLDLLQLAKIIVESDERDYLQIAQEVIEKHRKTSEA